MKPWVQVLFGAAALLCAPFASADTYPSKPIRLVIPTAPGGGTDNIGRVVGDALGKVLKVTVVAENRPGASGKFGSELVWKSAPDGYTLLIVQNSHTLNPSFLKSLPYDTVNDFTAVAPLARSPLVLVSSAESNVKTWSEFVATGKREKNPLAIATSESSSRLAVEQLHEATRLQYTALPYKGTAPAMVDVAGGHVHYTVTTMASALPFVSKQKVHFLATLAHERSSFVPEVPTLTELGVPGVEVLGWWGIFGPAKMPPEVVAKLNAAINEVLQQPQVKASLQTALADAWVGSAKDLEQFVRSEVPKYARIAKQAGIEPE